jgi:hypothetical protein
MPDLFFYRDQEEAVKEEPAAVVEAAQPDYDQIQAPMDNADWDQGVVGGQAVGGQAMGFTANEDWSAATEDWNKPSAGAQSVSQDWNAASGQAAWNA